MNPIEDTNLADLIIEASNEVIEKRREKAKEQIMAMLERITFLDIEVKNMEKNLLNKKTELVKMQGRLETLRKGDWNVLQDVGKKEQDEKS